MTTFQTKNQGVAALLRYLHGPAVHRKTRLERPRGVVFEFRDPDGQSHSVSRAFHGDDGGAGFAITDAKSLIGEFTAVRQTMTDAINGGSGEWTNKDE